MGSMVRKKGSSLYTLSFFFNRYAYHSQCDIFQIVWQQQKYIEYDVHEAFKRKTDGIKMSTFNSSNAYEYYIRNKCVRVNIIITDELSTQWQPLYNAIDKDKQFLCENESKTFSQTI